VDTALTSFVSLGTHCVQTFRLCPLAVISPTDSPVKSSKPATTAVLACLLTFGGWAGLAEAATEKPAHTDQHSNTADEAPPLLTSTNAASVNPRPLLPPIALPSAHDTIAVTRRPFIAPMPTDSWSALTIAEAFWQHIQDAKRHDRWNATSTFR
jgi:hypothetical protein